MLISKLNDALGASIVYKGPSINRKFLGRKKFFYIFPSFIDAKSKRGGLCPLGGGIGESEKHKMWGGDVSFFW